MLWEIRTKIQVSPQMFFDLFYCEKDGHKKLECLFLKGDHKARIVQPDQIETN